MSNDDTLKDALTGAYSRPYLHTRLNEELKRAIRYDSSFSILLVDLDYFKSINDAFGHLKGDQILAEFAHLLKTEVRNSDLVFRYGGDEFVILMPYTSKNKAMVLADRLLEQVRAHHFGDKKTLNLTMSCGIATFPTDGNTAEDLFEIADQHHYLAKSNGRDCVICDSPHPYEVKPLEEVSRLIERDEAMSIVRSFIGALPENKRNVLRLCGEPGLGITRFLGEVSKIARLSGFGVLTLCGSPALENRKYSIIIDALIENSLVGIDEVESIIFSQDWLPKITGIFSQWLEEKGYSGLLITLENVPKIDRATLDILKSCYFASQEFPIGLVYADSGIQAQQLFPFGIQTKENVYLHPISLAGIQVWLRQSLRSEPIPEFVEWIAEKTKGYPAQIQKCLEELIRIGVIKKSQNGVSLSPNYKEDGFITQFASKIPSLQLELFNNPSTDFIGRHIEITTLKKLILDERTVTVVGMGGIGKSRLAVQAVLECQDRFTNGSLYVSMADVDDSVNVIYLLADALGLKLIGKLSERDQIISYLFNKEILILLDNIENIPMAVEFITDILENTLAVRFLLTARERLGIRHEAVFELEGLRVPPNHEMGEIEAYGAVQLFLHVARRGNPDFKVQDDDWLHIVNICRHLSGFPLGIELAAAWAESLSCSEIAAQLERETVVIPTSSSNHPSDVRSLASILESLWERFSPTEQELIIGMTLFRSSFSRQAAQSILGVSIFFLDALVNKSILRHTGKDRYLMHELINQQLRSEFDDTHSIFLSFRDKHAAFYLDLVKDVQALVSQSKEKQAYERISQDLENIRVAWHWTVGTRNFQSIQPAMQGLFSFFEQRGRFKEGKELFSDLLKCLSAESEAGNLTNSRHIMASLFEYIGKYDYHLGNYLNSQTLLDRALASFVDLDMLADVARTRLQLANLKRAQGEYSAARELLNASLKYYQEDGDPRAQGDILNSLGVIASGLGEIDLAEKYYAAALEKFQQLADAGKISRALNNLGYSYMEKGDYQASLPLLLESLELARDIGAEPLSGAVLDSLGALHYAMGDYTSSIRYYREGLKLCGKLNALPLTLEILLGFAMVFNKQGNISQAVDLMCLVYRHPSVVHEIRERAKGMLLNLPPEQSEECLSQGAVEITSLDVDHTITSILYPH